MRLKSNEDGKCPFCNSFDLDYGALEVADNYVYYPWTCNECGKSGDEFYELKFVGHNVYDEDGNSIIVSEDMID